MRYNKSLIRTMRENPANCESETFALMLKTGMVKQESAGLYTYLPYFNMLMQKVENEIRKQMNSLNAQECKFQILVTRELLEKSGRWTSFGKEMFSLKDRSGNEYALSPTNEEAATMIAKQFVTSFKDLPLIVYQINTKHRDEIRPRGMGRTRAFTMKDAYSFHTSEECLDETYKKIVDKYLVIFKRLGLDCFPVNADNGTMGGSGSQEIMTISSEGDNEVGKCNKCGYSANLEVFPCLEPKGEVSKLKAQFEKVETPNVKTIDELAKFFNADASNYAKSIVYKTDEGKLVVAVVRGDREINEIKLRNVLKVKSVELCAPEEIQNLNSYVGFVGPINLKENTTIICDYEIKHMQNFIIGANQLNYHYKNVNVLDLDKCEFADIRVATAGDKHYCDGDIEIVKAVELGHCFKLGKRYTDKLDVCYIDNNNKPQTMTMGCYGIGLERTACEIISKYHDEFGLCLPMALSPFKVCVIAGDKFTDIGEQIYNELMENDIETLLDDRNVTFGVKFKDSDLLGIPLKVVVGKNYENTGELEIEFRKGDKISVKKQDLTKTLKNIIDQRTQEFYNN